MASLTFGLLFCIAFLFFALKCTLSGEFVYYFVIASVILVLQTTNAEMVVRGKKMLLCIIYETASHQNEEIGTRRQIELSFVPGGLDFWLLPGVQ